MPNKKIFISYAHEDREFARTIDAALRIAGVSTFLDERDIRVGDSITGRVFHAIDTATEVLYLISANSAQSAWAADELAAAKFRQRSEPGFRILPLRLDDTPVPTVIADLRWVDMRGWRDARQYRVATLDLLAALDVEAPLIGIEHIAWWLTNRDRIRPLWFRIREMYFLADNCVGYWQWFNNTGWLKKAAREIPFNWVLSALIELVKVQSERDVRFEELTAAANETLAAYGAGLSEPVGINRFWQSLSRLDSMLDNFDSEATLSLFAAMRTSLDDVASRSQISDQVEARIRYISRKI